MTATVTAAGGYDLGYVWKNQAQGKDANAEREQAKGGYYISAAQKGEPPGRWFGKGAEALGFGKGQVVEREPYDKVYAQVHPGDGSKLGRAPGSYQQKHDILLVLKEAEPHATSERLAELERIAAAAARKSPAYTDITVSLVKSVSIFHASVRENERLARLAGDEAAAAWWAARDAEVQEALQNANRAAMQHLQDWAVTRTGHHGARVDGQEPGKYEAAGLVVTSWLQGTSRDGDPQDHIHNQIARMSLTGRDGKWRAVDTMAVRAQIGAARATFAAHFRAEMTRRFGVEWVPRKDGDGQEIAGITRAQIEAYSTRTQRIHEKTPEIVEAWKREHGGAEPNRRELLYLQKAATMASRENKPEGDIDWDEYLREWAGKWEAEDGSSLAAVAGKVSSLRGPGSAPREPGEPGRALSAGAQLRVMQAALARVQERDPTWTRADLMRAIADALPPETAQMTPADSVALVHELTDRTLSGEAGQVMSLEAPDHLDTPGYLRRELDGKSMYTRPGVERFTTRVQIAREKELLASMEKEGAPHLTREQAAELLGATEEELEAAARAKVNEATPTLPSGMTLAQAAAVYVSLTSDRTGYAIVGPAGTGKTYVAAMQARIWEAAGRGDVILTGPSEASCNALREATGHRFLVLNNAQLLGHLEGRRGALGPIAIKPGTLIQGDEASMSSINDLHDLVRLAEANGATFRALGDDGQLTAPEGGGGLSLMTRNHEHVQLAEPKRFAAAWEADASLRVRAGDAAILDEYEQQGRIRGGGTLDEVMDQAARQYLAGYLQGKDVLLMTQSNDHAREISARIRDELQHLGRVGRGPEASLREGAKASAGDLIVTRKNDHSLGIDNGDTWRVEHVDGETITMRKMLDADRETGERRFADETIVYKAAREHADLAYAQTPAWEDEQQEGATRPADLGYSITGHTGQGRTVWQGNALFTGSENRNWAYPALTRGTHGNYAWVVGQPAKVADPEQGTRTAPELERQARVERERAGLPADPRELTPQEQELARDPKDVLADVLERDGTVYSALETRQRNLSNADHLGVLHAIWQGETREPVNARYEHELRDQLPDGFKNAKLSGHATWLYRTLRDAEAAGLDSRQVLARAVNSQPLAGTRDIAAVVDARVRAQTTGLVPVLPKAWAQRVPEDDHQERHEYLGRVGKAMDDRTRRLGEHTAEARPAWAERAFGQVPDDPDQRQAWQDRASAVASYREMFGWSDPDEPIGPEPVNSPEARQQWQAAFAAIGPADGQDLRALSDGQLLLRRGTYERETAWAPHWVGDQLRQVRAGAGDAERNAVLSSARAEAARKQDKHEKAQLHDMLARSQRAMAESYRGLESRFAATMEARKDWEETTRQQRHDALAAHTEYVRRHPDTDLPPLKSSEPERPTEEEHAQIHVPEIEEWEPPAWLADMDDRTRAANEEIADRRSMRVPDEDPTWEPQRAWPAEMTLHRDAILQPPPPQIPPARGVAERAAQMDREAGD